tara:strand:+ start:418 stop:708 length:291 start_codon:yes stop_codon:yes gene_type:complete
MKNALIDNEVLLGQDNRGYRVAETSDVQFEVNPTHLIWRDDCPDNVEQDIYWFDPVTITYRLNPVYVQLPNGPDPTVSPIPADYIWDWNTDSWVHV